MIQKLIDDPAILIAILALLVSVLSFVAALHSATSARRSTKVSEKVAEASRPHIEILITELREIRAEKGIFTGSIVFELTNKGSRVASNLTHRVFHIYKLNRLQDFKLEHYSELAKSVRVQFANETIFPGDNQSLMQSFSGEVAEAVSEHEFGSVFHLVVVVAVQYTDDLTGNTHWTFEVLPVATKNSAGETVPVIVDSHDFALENLVVHRSSWSSFRS